MNKVFWRVRLLVGLFTVAILPNARAQPSVRLASPDGRLVLTVGPSDRDGLEDSLSYKVDYEGQPVVLDSQLGLDLANDVSLLDHMVISASDRRTNDTKWRPVYGERAVVRDFYSEVVVTAKQQQEPGIRVQLVCRAYNEGVAWRYVVPQQDRLRQLEIEAERTFFRFAAGSTAYVARAAQSECHPIELAEFTGQAERPLTLRLANGLYASIAEAALVDYARMRLAAVKGRPDTLVSALAGPVTLSLPAKTPWRVVMVAQQPGQLLENNDLIRNLNDPCAITDTSWIKPGKVLREVTVSTAGGKACVDFAVAHNLQYIEYDAGWYGHEYDELSDATTVTVDPKRNPKGDLDLPDVLQYAKSKGVGVIVYVNRRALERQLDEILPLYRQWGIAGVKYGFVNVGSQRWTRWLHEAIRKAAEHQLMVDVHDEYRPTGFSRTYPNLMTMEGIHGNETMPTASQNLMLPFTRFICGAGDATICYYHNITNPNSTRNVQTTPAHQLAVAVVFYSPWQFVFWYDRPQAYQGEPEIAFFKEVPTVWDDTKVLHGEIGQTITVARRTDEQWFVGTLNNENPRTMEIPLSFVGSARKYVAHVYEDGGQEIPTRTHVKINRYVVDRNTVLRADLSPGGGQAVRLVPARPDDLTALPPYSP